MLLGTPGVRAAAELQGVARAGSARHRPRGFARSADVERGRARQRLQRGRLRRAGVVHLRPRLRRHRRLQPRRLHRHVDGQPVAERRQVRRRRRQLVALPHRRRREGARPARQPHRTGHPRHVQRRVHHVGRARAADPRRAAVRDGDARRSGPPGPARGVRGRGARRRVRRLPRADRLGEGRRSVAARRRHQHAGGVPRPGRRGQPRHAADRPRRPGGLPELAARRVRCARRAPGRAVRAQPAARADLHQGRGRRGPRQRGARRAEEERLRRDRGSGRRPLPLPPGQVRQPDRGRGARRWSRPRASRCSSCCRRSSCSSRCSSSGCW